MRERGWSGAGLARGVLLGGLIGGLIAWGLAAPAQADCLRKIYNRSSLVLVARQDGGPPATLLPGQSLTVRLARPGQVALSAYCGVPGPNGALTPVTSASFDYEAVLDRCFYRFGQPLFVPQLGRGFFGTQDTAPFTVNNPRQGDVILGPLDAPSCPNVLSRGG
ncbi:hypothetical protein Q8W71_23455 [Methylobacterium sp. NEAU 140]|uniref:hypothetical protein n=1 Tax=Methylobacterium sp. NEAU 140 TaxID=3064945 RepID=UPI0027374317|nr:hypothetical protein [Methylobacterium sp. NEAU 140]MDP4025596.1 hypothetical protein [Methylobacterium sp. NEAU 140]